MRGERSSRLEDEQGRLERSGPKLHNRVSNFSPLGSALVNNYSSDDKTGFAGDSLSLAALTS